MKFTCLGINRHNQRHSAFVSQLLALTHGVACDLFKSAIVDEGAPYLFFVNYDSPFTVELEHVAILDQNNILFRITEMVLHKLLVSKKHAVFTMDRDDKLRPHCFCHDANIFLRSMAADVHEPSFLFNDICTTLVNESNHSGDQTFVTRNDAG